MPREVFLFFILFFLWFGAMGFFGSESCQKGEYLTPFLQLTCSLALFISLFFGFSFMCCLSKGRTYHEEGYYEDEDEDDYDE